MLVHFTVPIVRVFAKLEARVVRTCTLRMPLEGESVFKRVLIANRGEIAIRVARAASALGVESVSVYAPADALSLHTRVTTESRALGETRSRGSSHAKDTPPAASSDPVRAYLDIDALIEAAKASRCDSVHPGYGFLSEQSAFAQRCLEEGLAFIGPRPETLRLFGDKTQARELAHALGIPIIPGSPHAVASAEEARAIAEQIGYPVMLKAAVSERGANPRFVVSSLAEFAPALLYHAYCERGQCENFI